MSRLRQRIERLEAELATRQGGGYAAAFQSWEEATHDLFICYQYAEAWQPLEAIEAEARRRGDRLTLVVYGDWPPGREPIISMDMPHESTTTD